VLAYRSTYSIISYTVSYDDISITGELYCPTLITHAPTVPALEKREEMRNTRQENPQREKASKKQERKKKEEENSQSLMIIITIKKEKKKRKKTTHMK